jgi:hypothetical protein
MRFDSFTIFLIVLIGFVVVVLLTNWFTNYKPTETFVNFRMNQNIGSAVYIPQYSAKNTNTVLSLYDSLYFDYQNGTLIEVLAPESTSGTNDLTGSTITGISVAPRDGVSTSKYDAQKLNSDGSVPGYATPQSLVTTTPVLYNQFPYKTIGTNHYQAFYFSWNKNTFIHLVNLNIDKDGTIGSNGCGANLKTFTITPNGLMNTVSITDDLPDYTPNTDMVKATSDTQYRNASYLNAANLYKIATSPPTTGLSATGSAPVGTSSPSGIINISYDITNGNIIIDGPNDLLKIYNRGGNGSIINGTANSIPFTTLSATNVFVIKDVYPFAAVLVIAYQNNTIVSVIAPSTNKYTLVNTVRFNKTKAVNNTESDSEYTDNTAETALPDDRSKHFGKKYNHGNDNEDMINLCGDDLSCKLYWHFNSILDDPRFKSTVEKGLDSIGQQYANNNNILSDDYFLKTEVVPPVCPQCPMCPDYGVCQNCGGNGGSGTCNSKPGLTPSPTTPGTFTDGSGNIFVLQTDANGNKTYIPLSKLVNNNTIGAGSKSAASNAANITGAADANGQFITTADPNTIGGGLSVATMSIDKLGSTAFNTTGSVANNLISTTGDVVKGVVGTAGSLVGGTIGTAADLAKGAGSGLMQLGNKQGNTGLSTNGPVVESTAVSSGGTVSGSSLSPVSDKTFGNIPGKTPVDNYSYYGALQTKGSNYMPVTADFSSFRK